MLQAPTAIRISAGWQIIDDPDNMTCGEGADAGTLTSYSSGVIGLPRTGLNNASGGGLLRVEGNVFPPPQQLITLPALAAGFYYITEISLKIMLGNNQNAPDVRYMSIGSAAAHQNADERRQDQCVCCRRFCSTHDPRH
jgi:hypothetical protein